jgi:hypothetical protein
MLHQPQKHHQQEVDDEPTEKKAGENYQKIIPHTISSISPSFKLEPPWDLSVNTVNWTLEDCRMEAKEILQL